MSNLSIIDADSIIHVIAYHYEVGKEATDLAVLEDGTPDLDVIFDMYKTGFDHKAVLDRVDSFIQDILSTTRAQAYLGYIATEAAGRTFRHDIATVKPYKGKRPSTPLRVKYWKPIITEHLVTKWGFHRVSGVEVDDICTIANTLYHNKGTYVTTLCSPDKDLKQVPGIHYDYKKQETYVIDEPEANRRLFTQCIVGDNSDGVPGLFREGAKSKLLTFPNCVTFNDLYNYTLECYRQKGKTKAEFTEQLKLVYMARSTKYLEGYGYVAPEGLFIPIQLKTEQPSIVDSFDAPAIPDFM